MYNINSHSKHLINIDKFDNRIYNDIKVENINKP